VSARRADEALQPRGEGALVKSVCPWEKRCYPGRATDRGDS
jgi:hypothetical protein